MTLSNSSCAREELITRAAFKEYANNKTPEKAYYMWTFQENARPLAKFIRRDKIFT
jgi:hypothetical protein